MLKIGLFEYILPLKSVEAQRTEIRLVL